MKLEAATTKDKHNTSTRLHQALIIEVFHAGTRPRYKVGPQRLPEHTLEIGAIKLTAATRAHTGIA